MKNGSSIEIDADNKLTFILGPNLTSTQYSEDIRQANSVIWPGDKFHVSDARNMPVFTIATKKGKENFYFTDLITGEQLTELPKLRMYPNPTIITPETEIEIVPVRSRSSGIQTREG